VKLGNPNAANAWKQAEISIRRNRLAFAQSALKSIKEIHATGITSLNRIADCMNKRGEPTARGGRWQAITVKRVLECK
jgi:hypothetical protein